jgi:hypothetical protein
MAKVKIVGVAARKTIFNQFAKKENFKIVRVEGTIQREGQNELLSILCRPTEQVSLDTCKNKDGVYLLPIFNSYDTNLKVGDIGTVTTEKGNGENAQERFIFSKNTDMFEAEL